MSSKVAAVFSTLADRFNVSHCDLLGLESHGMTTCDDFYYNLSSEQAPFSIQQTVMTDVCGPLLVTYAVLFCSSESLPVIKSD